MAKLDGDSNDIIAANATLYGPEIDHDNARCRGSSSDTTANKINPCYLIG